MSSCIVVGGGIFGVTAALALRRRGRDVTLVDAGPIPHPLGESTDISKIVRLDYGADEEYTAMMERALDGWRRWNGAFARPLFHETGVLFLTRDPMAPGGFEHDGHALLTRRGHRVERVDRTTIARRFPAFGAIYQDGYWNPQGGWAESGNVVEHLAAEARNANVTIAENVPVASLLEEEKGRIAGVVTRDGVVLRADTVIVTSGSWTGELLPWLASHLASVGQPVFHLAPSDGSSFAAEGFPVFAADIARTGWYGFPANRGGVVKIANHGVGRAMSPESAEREVTIDEIAAFTSFVRESIPALADAAIATTRICVYGDTRDRHFWIAPDPERAGLVVACGGSGHAFKFAPILGDLIADAAEGVVQPRFRWRTDAPEARGQELARHEG